MSVSSLIRQGAMSAIVGGALLAISELWGLLTQGFGGDQPFSQTATTASFAITGGMSLLATILILFGLVGLHLRQAQRAGVLGWLGFLIAFLGTALAVGASWAMFFVAPSAALVAPEFLDADPPPGILNIGFILFSLLLALGWTLFGAGAFLARTYPRWVAIVLVVAALIQLLPLPGTAIVFGVAVALLGFFALTRARISEEQTSHVR